jgi:transposase-like protein
MDTQGAPRKTTVMRMLEDKHGKDIREIIVETYNRCGSVEETAEDLGVSKMGLQKWIKRFGINLRSIAELPAAVEAA